MTCKKPILGVSNMCITMCITYVYNVHNFLTPKNYVHNMFITCWVIHKPKISKKLYLTIQSYPNFESYAHYTHAYYY